MSQGRAPGYFSLFASVGTLVCCALPSLLVVLGFGATVASLVSSVPWLVALSRHKAWVFGASALLIAGNFYYVYRLVPRLLARVPACPPEEADACARASRFSRLLLWGSAAIWVAGFFVAYILAGILQWLEG